MKNNFKKIVSVVLSFLLIATQLVVFASDAQAPTIEDYQSISDPVKITGTAYASDDPWSVFSDSFSICDSWGVIYKVDFPKMDGKKFENFIFRFGTQIYSGNKLRIMGVPASTNVESLAYTDEPFKSMWANEGAYISNVGDVLDYNVASNYYINYADLTAYANECLDAGDTYMYLLVNCSSTGKAFSSNLVDSTYISLDLYPYYYYNTIGAPVVESELKLTKSTPENGATNVDASSAISLEFNSGIEFADATINGEAVEAVCDGSTVVTIDTALQPGTEYVIVANVIDAQFNELSVTINFTTKAAPTEYDPENPTIEGIQMISAPVKITGTAYASDDPWTPYTDATSISDHWGTLYRVDFPEMQGMEFKNFIFRFGTQIYSGNKLRIMGVPVDTDVENLAYTDEPFKSMWANEGAYISNVGDVLDYNVGENYYINYADITTYANECLRAGDSYMYLLVNCSSTAKAFGSNLADSTYIGYDLYPYYYYNTAEKIVFDPENPTIEGIQTISAPVQITAPTYGSDAPWTTFADSSSICDSWGVVYRVDFPEMTGKEFKNFIFRFGTQIYSGNSIRIMGVPADTDVENLAYTDEPFKSMWANEGAYISSVGDVLDYNVASNCYINYANLTAYANECLDAGDTYMYLLVNCSSTAKAFGSNITDSTYKAWDLFPYYYYDTNDRDIELILKETSPENGATNVNSACTVEFTFSNTIEFASVTVNGVDVDAEWENNKVVVNADLKQYTKYEVKIDVVDIYGQEMVCETEFTTGGAYTSAKLSDGESWHISASGSTAMTSRENIDLRANNFVLHKIPVPAVAEGEILDSYIFGYTLYPSGYPTMVLKFEGEDWDPSSMKTTDDEVAQILANYADYNVAKNQMSEEVETSHYLHTNDITAYVNECILLGQEYMYLGVITPASTMQSFGYNVSDSSWKRFAAYGQYSTVYPEISIVDAKYEVNGAFLTDASMRVLTDAEDFADSVILRDAAAKTKIEASFAYDEFSRILSLESPVSLSENTKYEIVIKAGTEDYYGNVASEDVVCISFETGVNYVISPVKLVSADSSDYDNAEAVLAPDKTSSYKGSAKLTNNTKADVDVIIFVAKYDASGKVLLGVSTEKTTIAAKAENVDVFTDVLEQNGEDGVIKVSLWSGNLKPLSETLAFEIK